MCISIMFTQKWIKSDICNVERSNQTQNLKMKC